jgi:hypothetical protein
MMAMAPQALDQAMLWLFSRVLLYRIFCGLMRRMSATASGVKLMFTALCTEKRWKKRERGSTRDGQVGVFERAL